MPVLRRARARFSRVTPTARGELQGVDLRFHPLRNHLGVEHFEDFAAIGPELCIPAVEGIGKILRILRAARIAAPRQEADLLGQEELVRGLLERAVGTELALGLRPRSRVRFDALTEDGRVVFEDVQEVVELPHEYLVVHKRGRFPTRVPRETVLRQQTDCERWFEVVEIDRS
jgi:hypothetical protein